MKNVLAKPFNELVSTLNRAMKTGMYHYCDLETAISDDMLLTKEGGLTTCYQIMGTASLAGDNEITRIIEEIDTLKGNLEEKGIVLQFCFTRDPSQGRSLINDYLGQLRLTERNHNVALGAVIDDRKPILESMLSYEQCLLTIKTLPIALENRVLKSEKEAMVKLYQQEKFDTGETGQSSIQFAESLVTQHTSYCDIIEQTLKSSIEFEKLSSKKALSLLKQSIDGEQFAGFQPIVIGDPHLSSLTSEGHEKDCSHLAYPALGYQLFDLPIDYASEHKYADPTLVKYGSTFLAPLTLDLPPQTLFNFNKLFHLIERNIPYRLSIRLKTGHSALKNKLRFKKNIANMVKALSSVSADIAKHASDIETRQDTLLQVNITLVTWGSTLDVAIERRLAIKRALTSWGNPSVVIERGDAIAAWAENLPVLFSDQTVSAPFALPLTSAARILPIFRPSSPFKKGQSLYQTVDGKMIPFENFSSSMAMWVTILCGRPGYGKSVQLSDLLASQVRCAGNEPLPFQSILDVNPSSQYYIESIQSSMPPHLQKQVQFLKVSNTKTYAINVFDTRLGAQKPVGEDIDFTKSVITTILTPPGQSIEDLPGFVSVLITNAYDYYSRIKPKRYIKNLDQDIDKILTKFQVSLPELPSWWEVADALFHQNLVQEAIQAQRYAVPTISDLSEVIAQDKNLQDIFANTKVRSESIINFVNRQLQVVINNFPSLVVPSRISFDQSRIIAVNLSLIAGGIDEESRHRMSIFYMIYMYLMCSRFFIDDDIIQQFPKAYQAYHRERLYELQRTPKTVAFDEYHRTNKHPVIIQESLRCLREGRKYKVSMVLASQFLMDFPDTMRKAATVIFLMDSGSSKEDKNELQQRLGYDDDTRRVFDREVKGPTKKGASFLMFVNRKNKPGLWLICYNKLGPVDLWQYESGAESAQLRHRLKQALGHDQACRALATIYPKGNIQAEYEALKTSDESSEEKDIISKFMDHILTQLSHKGYDHEKDH